MNDLKGLLDDNCQKFNGPMSDQVDLDLGNSTLKGSFVSSDKKKRKSRDMAFVTRDLLTGINN